MNQSDITLLALGFMGVLLHCLVKINKLKTAGGDINYGKYFSKEWPAIAISIVVLLVAIICKNDIEALKAAGSYLGIGFVTIGYMGQSLLVFFMDKASEKIGIDKDQIDQ